MANAAAPIQERPSLFWRLVRRTGRLRQNDEHCLHYFRLQVSRTIDRLILKLNTQMTSFFVHIDKKAKNAMYQETINNCLDFLMSIFWINIPVSGVVLGT